MRILTLGLVLQSSLIVSPAVVRELPLSQTLSISQ